MLCAMPSRHHSDDERIPRLSTEIKGNCIRHITGI